MDQTAFRQLLSTPRSNVASSEPSSSIPGAARHFGKVKKRDGLQSVSKIPLLFDHRIFFDEQFELSMSISHQLRLIYYLEGSNEVSSLMVQLLTRSRSRLSIASLEKNMLIEQRRED